MRIFFETNNRRLPLFTVFSGLSVSRNIYCSDIVHTKTVTNANGFKSAVQSINLYPVRPAKANTKTLQHTFVMAKLQFFACPGSCMFISKTHHALRKLISVFAKNAQIVTQYPEVDLD